ncbi:MAG: hypothetical protein ACFFEN_07900 [Candidatus Thorarchaeota archaeon]
MRKRRSLYSITFIILFLIGSLNYFLSLNFNYVEKSETLESFANNREISDIAGTDLYAELINAYVAGDKSIIKQSLFTNDTNIFSQFDTNDPAFYKCNLLISASNTIQPGIFPNVLTESTISDQYSIGFNRFVGFLYYDDELSPDDAMLRADRALEIIRQKFKIDLILVNTSEPNFFPFIGDYPNWEILLNELTSNLPMDGYWKALDISRLISEEYINSHHLSSTFITLNSLDFLDGDFEITTKQLDFNVDSIDLSFLENLATEDLVEQFNNIIENYGDLFNATISEEEIEQFVEIFSSFTLSNNSHYTSLFIQYEGLPEGIIKIGKDQYKFNLWNAMGYSGGSLAPSEKIYIALIGAFMTDIEINILCTEIIDVTPINFKFYDYLLEQVGLLLYLAGVEFDVQALKDYSFELFWVNEEGLKRSYVKIVNLDDPTDIINLLQQFGFQGFSFIPTGIINPIDDFIITYNLSRSEPNLVIYKDVIGGNASYGAFRDFSYEISAMNVGNTTAWGKPTPIPLELDNFFTIISPLFWENVRDDMWSVINIEYPNQYESLEDFFNFDEDPRIFYFDTFGMGIFDSFYPDFLNITNLWPYNENADYIIDIVANANPIYFTIFSPEEVKDLFTNENSIWNDDNWILEPGEQISYQILNYSISDLDSFSPFYRNNFTIGINPQTPEIVSGVIFGSSTPVMALETDNESWIIESVENLMNQRIEIDFIFNNDSLVDLSNNTLEKVSIIINFTTSEDLDSLEFEIFNFEKEEFQNMTQYLDVIENNSLTFSIINNNESLDWLFYSLDKPNFTTLFKIIGINSEKFNISINNLDIEFSRRDININDDFGSRIVFSSSTGNIEYESMSNSISLSTFDMASIIAQSFITKYYANQGNLNTYVLKFKNIGSQTAENISISLLIPGIMNDTNDFYLENSNLTYYLSKLAPAEENVINFTFYTPNTRKISKVSISYNNPENVEGGNSSKIITFTNEVYVSSPVDYKKHVPFLRVIEFKYLENKIINNNDYNTRLFNITFILKNDSPFGLKIPDLNISCTDQIGDIVRIDKKQLYFEYINYNETLTFNITVKKVGSICYYYPPINFITSSETITIQISHAASLIMGVIDFTLTKYVDKQQVKIGDKITVFIDVKNTGTINVSNIVVNDIISYSQSDFSLIKGNLVNFIDNIEPGSVISISYQIRAKRQALVTLNPAIISYYYLHKLEEISNVVSIKINTPQLDQLLYAILPGSIVIIIIIVFYRQSKKYRNRKDELRRTERFFFDMSSRESILKVRQTLRQRLRNLSKLSTKDRD